jgi:hypothetical protein
MGIGSGRDRMRRWRARRRTAQVAARRWRIFINPRHEDMPFAASTLYRELKGRFGAESIFFDSGCSPSRIGTPRGR